MSDSIEERVIKVVSEQLGISRDEIQPASAFVDDLKADSLDTVELVMALEEEFDLTIPDEMSEKIMTVQQAVDFIRDYESKAAQDQATGSGN